MKYKDIKEVVSEAACGENGFVVARSLAVLMVAVVAVSVAIVGLAAIWQTIAQAQEPEGPAVVQEASSSESAAVGTDDLAGGSSLNSAEAGNTGEGEDSASDHDASFDSDDDSSANDEADSTGAAESRDAERSVDASALQSADEDDDSSASAAVSPKESAHTYKASITTLKGNRYTVTVAADSDAGIPENAELRLVNVVQTPDGYSPKKAEWKNRPSSEERFVSAAKMNSRMRALRGALDVQEDDYVFFSEFMDIALIADGKEVQPAGAVKVTLETDGVLASESDAVALSFFTQRRNGREFGDALAVRNLSGDKEKTYKKYAKFSFEADELSELGIAGVAVPLAAGQVANSEVTILGPWGSDAWTDQIEINGDLLPSDVELVGAFSFGVDPRRAYGNSLWLEIAPADSDAAGGSVLTCFRITDGAAVRLLDSEGAGVPVQIDADDVVAFALASAEAEQSEAEGDDAGANEAKKRDDSKSGEQDSGADASESPEAQDKANEVSETASLYDFTAGLAPSYVLDARQDRVGKLKTQAAYTVTWKNGDQELGTASVEEGETPAYVGDTPTREPDAQYTYEFSGWKAEGSEDSADVITDDFPVVTGDVTYLAQFTETLRTYKVIWKNWDGATLKTDDNVPYGTVPEYDGTEPYKPADANTPRYTFTGWSPEPAAIEGDEVYTAQFTSAIVGLHVFDKNSATQQGIANAVFTLTNSDEVVVWKGTTGSSGNLYIEEASSEPTESRSQDGGGAVFADGSIYTLVQTKTDDDHFCPQGTWMLAVSGTGTQREFTLTAVKASALDLSTIQPEHYGISFYIPNERVATLTYTTTRPDGTIDDTESEKLSFLSYSGEYTIEKQDLTDNANEFEFVGWADANNEVWKHGDTLTLNTVSIKDHILTSAWRIPLSLGVYTYSGGSIESAQLVADSEGTFALDAESTRTYSTMDALGRAYQNEAAQAIANNDGYGLTLAKITNESDPAKDVRVTAMRYDSAAHAWQYRSGSNAWHDLAVGDKLSLYYTSNTINVVWMKDEDGILSPLDESAFPTKAFSVGDDRWYTPDDLFGSEQAKLEASVEGDYYFQYYLMGTEDLAEEALAESVDFQLKNSDQGFQYRADAAGAVENLTELTTLYLVYAKTPPAASARMDIENLTDSQFRIRELQVENADALSAHRVIVETEDGLRIFDGVTSWTEGKHAALTLDKDTIAHLVLLDAAGKKYALDGVFETNPGSVSYGIGSVDNEVVKRAMLSEYQITQTTRSATTGTLDSHAGKTILSFSDAPEGTFTVNKAWSDDVNKSAMQATFDLYEISLGTAGEWPASIPLTDIVSEGTVSDTLREQGYTVLKLSRGGDNYTIRNSDRWKRTYSSLPPLSDRRYFAIETSATRNGVESLADYKRAYSFSGDASETVSNTRADNICRVGQEVFPTLGSAVAYITEQGLTTATIEMLQDYVVPAADAVTFPEGCNVTLTTATDVEGFATAVLYRGFSGASDMIAVEGSLTVSNLTLDGKVPSNSGRSGNSGNGGLVTVKPGAVLNVEDGATFQNGQAANGSAIFAEDGTGSAPTRVVFTGGTVTGNYVGSNGGAVGVGGSNARVEVSGNVTIYDNHRVNYGGQFNLCLNQDSDEIIRVTGEGLGSDARIGVYVTGSTNEGDPWKEHGRPAKAFATYETSANNNLNAFSNDRFTEDGIDLNRGFASVLSDYADKVVWGETFSFTVDIQWLDADYQKQDAPDGASATLKLNLPIGSTTRGDAYHDAAVTESKYTFEGLARYSTDGTPCEYAVSETSVSPHDYSQVFFYGDRGVAMRNGSSTTYEVSGIYKDDKYKNNLVYDAAASDSQRVIISNRYRFTTFAVKKVVKGLPDETSTLNSSFTLMRVPKYGVGGANDLPNGLRSVDVPEAWEHVTTLQDGAAVTFAATTRFFTLYGGNNWYCQVSDETATAEELQGGIDGYAGSGKGLVKFNSYHDTTKETGYSAWQRGDVKYDGASYSVYDGSAWHPLDYSGDAQRPDVDIRYTHQDGSEGAESAGGDYGATSSGKSCKITTTGNGEGTYVFETGDELSSDYIYYAIETATNLPAPDGRLISGSAKLISAYNPVYDYDQVNRSVTVTNTWRSVLAVEKKWTGDANRGTCVFDLYKLTNANGGMLSKSILNDQVLFRVLVEKGEDAILSGITVTKLDGAFSLRDDDADGREGSWVHAVTETELGETYDPAAVYFARERTVNGFEVTRHAVADADNPDAVYRYEEDANLLVVTNLGDILCKVVDDDGTENVFRTLNDAYAYGITRTAGSQDEFTIEMLRDYDYPNDDKLNIEAGKKITLTTASTVETDACHFVYAPPQADPDKTRATISRGTKSGSFIVVTGNNANSAGLTLENIAFAGNGAEVIGNGGFVNASYTTIALKGTSLDNGVLMKGGAVSGSNHFGAAIYAENSETALTYASFEECKANGASNNGGALYITNKPLTINNSEFKKCEAKNGGAIYSSGSVIEIADSYFEECKSLQPFNINYGGGAVYTNEVLTINTSSFKECTAAACGGAIWSNKKVSIKGTASSKCVFDGCQAYKAGSVFTTGDVVGEFNYADFLESNATTGEGGAILQYKDNGQGQPDTSTTLDNCYFYKCTAPGKSDSSGGALQTNMRSLTVTNSKFEECSAGAKQGGAIQHYLGSKVEESTANFENVDFIRCVANGNQGKSYGGGFNTDAYTATVDNCRFTECSAVVGGAFSNCSNNNSNKDGSLTVQNCFFTSCNTSDHTRGTSGGAIYATKKNVTITDATFNNCEAKGEGGGIYQDNNAADSILTLTDCAFDTCKTKDANKSGGGIRANAASVTVAGTTFKDCTATGSGGGLYQANTNNAARLIVTSTGSSASSFTNCTSTNGNGGGIWTSAKNIGTTEGTDKQPIEASFSNCKAENGSGGGMCVENGASAVALEGCSFNGCVAKNYGGGIHSNGLALTANSCTLSQCEVLNKDDGNAGGGGMSTSSGNAGSMTWLKGCTFENCISARNGGGLLTSNRILTIEEDGATATTFTGCKASNGQGGAIRQSQSNAGSEATLKECAIANCTASGSGGGLSTGVNTVSLVKSTFTDCTAGGAGGGLQSTYGSEGGATTLKGCAFTNCKSTGSDGGGAVYCATRELTAEDYVEGETSQSNTFTNCEAKNSGGGINHYQSNGTMTKLTNCTFVVCVSTGGDGGAVRTIAKTLEMDNCAVKDCRASTWGGGVNHSNGNVGTATKLNGGSFENCSVVNYEGGGLRSNARNAELADVAFINCHSDGTAGYGGGGLSYGNDDDNGTASVSGCTFTGCYCNESKNGGAILFRTKSLTVEGTTIDGAISTAGVSYSADYGGGIYSSRGEVEIKAKTVEVDGEQIVIRSEIKNCAVKASGGGIYQAGSRKMTVENTDLTGNSAGTSGGGVYYYPKNILTLDGCTVSVNSAGSYGGGVYYDSNDNSYGDAKRLVMKNGTAITYNTLSSGAVENGAGVYLRNGTTLVLGSESDDLDEDILTIYNNTARGEASNLRMLAQKLSGDPRMQNMISTTRPDILLYSNLKLSDDKTLGWIGVCTPGAAGTQFGLADVANRTNMAYFVSDDGVMNGKLDEANKAKIIWYAPPVCQITDANGKLLTYGPTNVEATFSSLYDAYVAFNTLAADYFKDGDRNVTPVQIQMLRSSYALDAELPALNRSCTLTTEPNTPLCTITRGKELTVSMFKVAPGIEMNVARITLDGGSKEEDDNGQSLAATSNGGIIWADQVSSVVLSQNATLRNSATSGNGGAVYLSGGATMEMKFNSIISDCSAGSNGGAIYVGPGASVATTQSPTIEGCHADRSGGAMYVGDSATVNLGTTTDVGPTIANNSSDGEGAGIYLYGTTSKLNIQGKIAFSDNLRSATINATNGGESYTRPRQDIYLQYNNASNAPNINVTGEINADDGSIWVWAYNRSHYLLNKQFAQRAGNVSDETLKVFRDAVDDSTAENRASQYYTGVKGSVATNIYWGVPGIDVFFKKIDGFGNLLTGAAFTLYTDASCQTPLEKDGPVTADVSDGTLESVSGDVIAEGTVLFEKVPVGVYYMRETSLPEGYVNSYSTGDGASGESNTYIVLVGASELEGATSREDRWAAEGILGDISAEYAAAQTNIDGEDGARQFAVFLMDPETGKAVPKPDIAGNGIMNLANAQHRVVLRKVDGSNNALAGAQFEIARKDGSLVSSMGANGKMTTTFASDENGIYFIDTLPYGTYYLHEITVPDGYSRLQGTNDNWFTLTVNENGVGYEEDVDGVKTITNMLAAEPEQPR